MKQSVLCDNYCQYLVSTLYKEIIQRMQNQEVPLGVNGTQWFLFR